MLTKSIKVVTRSIMVLTNSVEVGSRGLRRPQTLGRLGEHVPHGHAGTAP